MRNALRRRLLSLDERWLRATLGDEDVGALLGRTTEYRGGVAEV